MKVQGSDCSLIIKTSYIEMDIPYSNETIRENVLFLQEESAIDGDGVCRGIRKDNGVTGCVVTPLTLNTAPLLLFLAFGFAENPVFVSETRNLYKSVLKLIPFEDAEYFDVIQHRNSSKSNERKLFEECLIASFELRIEREESIKLRLDVKSESSPKVFISDESVVKETGERFYGDCVSYVINEQEYKNIYGLTFHYKKENGIKTELWIKRVLEQGNEIPEHIEELTITARLLRDKYEDRRFGIFSIMLKKLEMISDETNIDSSGAVMGMLRYYVSGSVESEVFSQGENAL